jgi:hypothetical protein
VPGNEGGKYVEGNVRPLCPSCHDVAHGGDGSNPWFRAQSKAGRVARELHPGMASRAGRKGARRLRELHSEGEMRAWRQKGARRANELHPDLAKQAGRRVHELHPDLASENMRRVNARYPDMAREAGRKGARRLHELYPKMAHGAHARWHVNRGIVNPDCALCRDGLSSDDVPPVPSGFRGPAMVGH